MVETRPRIFLVTGTDFVQRRFALESIKKKVLKELASPLNILTLYGKEIDKKNLQEKLLNFSFNREKIVIIKDAYNLTSVVKDFFFKNLRNILSYNYIILEMDKDYSQLVRDKKIISDRFLNLVLRKAITPLKYQKSSSSYNISFESFRHHIKRNDTSKAVYILEKLFENRVSDREREILGLQILGVLIAESSYLKNPLLKVKCFNYLWEADRLIKERGLEPRFVLTILLTKLLGANLI